MNEHIKFVGSVLLTLVFVGLVWFAWTGTPS